MHILSRNIYFAVFAALLVLLAMTVGAAYIDLGRFSLAVALGISATKAALIVLFFMHLRYSTRLTMIVAGAGIVWWGILVVLVISDYLSRGWVTAG